MASWHGAELTSTLQLLKEAAPALSAEYPRPGFPPFFPGVSTDEEFASIEAKHDRPFPEPVRRLYRAISGLTFDDWRDGERSFKSLIKALGSTDWPHPLDVDDADERWNRDDYCVFAQTIWGDEIVCCEHPPEHRPNSIIMLDHEMANNIPSECNPDWTTHVVFLADNLAEWLARWIACGYTEPAMTGEEEFVAPDVYLDFLKDHIHLNPRVVWARERLAELT